MRICAELVMTRCLRLHQSLGHHYVCVDKAWTEQLDSCPAGRFILLEANERCLLMVRDPRHLDRAAVRRGHRVQFTVKMLPITADGGQNWSHWMR